MPNKAVWSAAALGVSGAYLLNENLKDRRVKQEEEQQRQMYEDVQEVKKQRAARAAMRQRTGGTRTNGDANADNMFPFFAAKWERLAMMLDEVEALAKSMLGRQKSFKLPLLPSEHNEPAEVVLGALLALGDPCMDEDLKNCSNSPGLALAKLSAASLSLIRSVFEQKWPYNISDGDLGGIMRLAIRDDGPQRGEPSMVVLESCKRNISDLAGLTASLGLYIFQEDCFQNKLCGKPPKRRMRFTTASTGWNATGWNGRLYLTNFPNKSFSLPAYQTSQNTWACSYTNVRLESGTSQTCRAPNLERAKYHLATAMAYRTANVAASRLKELEESLVVAKPNLWNQKGVSLEHVAVKACNETEVLQFMEQSDRMLIEHNRAKICETISSILEKLIPCPNNPLDMEVVRRPTTALKMEVATFVQEYVQLLNLSYCEVPKFRNKPPSQCVSKSRVTDQATEGFLKSVPPAYHRMCRKYEKNERDRIDRSRNLVTPSPILTTAFLTGVCVLFVASMWTMFYLLFARYIGIHAFVFAGQFICSVGLGVWSAMTTLQMLRYPFRVPNGDSLMKDAWLVSECIVETLVRKLAILCGKPPLFERELHRLQVTCKQKHLVWKRRMARRDFYVALKRKRIGYDDCQRLLLTFLDDDQGADGPHLEDAVEGILPGSVEEVEDFLKLAVEDDAKQTETYKSATIEDCFQEIENAVNDCLQYVRGDRIYVEPDQDAVDAEATEF